MINVNNLFQAGVRTASSNAPALLTAFGAVGTVTTAVLAGKASFEAAGKIFDENKERSLVAVDPTDDSIYLTKTETAKLVWPLYIPAATSGVVTVGAIILSHRVSSRRAAVIAAAYALNEGKLEEYQDKVKEKFGIKKEKEARDEIVADNVKRDYDEGTLIFSPLDGKVVIHDDYTGRFFWSSIDEVNKAVNEINHEINMSLDNSAMLSAFYDALGLDPVSISNHFGWNSTERCEVDWSTSTTPDGKTPVHSFEFVNRPFMNPGDRRSF